MQSCESRLALRAALYRRAVACAWLTLSSQQECYSGLMLAELEDAIARELEGFYLRQHGQQRGLEIACALLSDLMESGPLKACPVLSLLGMTVMNELCSRHLNKSALH